LTDDIFSIFNLKETTRGLIIIDEQSMWSRVIFVNRQSYLVRRNLPHDPVLNQMSADPFNLYSFASRNIWSC